MSSYSNVKPSKSFIRAAGVHSGAIFSFQSSAGADFYTKWAELVVMNPIFTWEEEAITNFEAFLWPWSLREVAGGGFSYFMGCNTVLFDKIGVGNHCDFLYWLFSKPNNTGGSEGTKLSPEEPEKATNIHTCT